MSRVWGRVAFLRSPVLCAGKVLGRARAAEPGQAGTCNTPGMLKHLMVPRLQNLISVSKSLWWCWIPQLSLALMATAGGEGLALPPPPAAAPHLPGTWDMSVTENKRPKKIINKKKKNPERTFCSYMSKLNLLNGRKAICRSSNLHCIFIYHSHYT